MIYCKLLLIRKNKEMKQLKVTITILLLISIIMTSCGQGQNGIESYNPPGPLNNWRVYSANKFSINLAL